MTIAPHYAGEIVLGMAPAVTALTETMLALVTPVTPLAGFTGVAGLAGINVPAPALPAPNPPVSVPAAAAPTAVAAPPAPAAATPPAMAPPTLVPAATATGGVPVMPPPFTGAEAAAFAYLVGGRPVHGAPAKMRHPAPAAPQRSEAPAAAVAAAAAERQARRRRQREALKDPGNRYEYLDSNNTVASSASGAGQMGFPGTVRHETGSGVTGLITLTDSAAGAGPTVPMLPHTWEGPEDPALG
jgi:hypothetical protein